jgi:predicted transcriptional regulator
MRVRPIANPRFMEWYFLDIDNFKKLRPFYSGLRKVVTKEKFMSMRMSLPPLNEQQAIADFLDRETARIDGLIAKQEQLVQMLGERRQALISVTVTRGLGHRDATKDSGIEWLGEIPADWAVKQFRHVFKESREVNGAVPVGPMLSISGYHGVQVKEYAFESLQRDDEQLENYRVVRPHQLAVNTMWLNHGGLGVSETTGHMSPAYRAYWIERDVHPRYAHHLMRSDMYVIGYTALLTGIRPNSLQMSRDDLMGFPIVVPPLDEQQAIADFLDRETARIDKLTARADRTNRLLLERRQSLISAAVTGKLKVGV